LAAREMPNPNLISGEEQPIECIWLRKKRKRRKMCRSTRIGAFSSLLG
jgi:hypothetical protein